MDEAEGTSQQSVLLSRFGAMGLEATPLAGDRAVLVELPFGSEPLETPDGPRTPPAVRFVTVGADRIKCITPRALFYLPLIRVGDCRSRAQLEARIRDEWKQRLGELRKTREWLERLGIECEAPRATPQWVFRLGLEDKHARAASIQPNRVILPSTGPLSGLPLERVEDREFPIDRACSSAVELEIAVTTRLEELARYAERVSERRRRGQGEDRPRFLEVLERKPPILLVGAGLVADRALQDSLQIRGFEIATARSIDEAVARLHERSYELALTDARLDRSDGIELVPVLRAVAGIEEIPVVLVDDRPREARRQSARGAGAAGYVARPIDVSRMAVALARLIDAPRRRRFTRYQRALSVTWPGCSEPGVTANIGRGGMLVRAERDIPANGLIPCQIHLPELGKTVSVEAEIVSRLQEPGRLGIGMHFRSFPNGSERTWIEFLRSLEAAPR